MTSYQEEKQIKGAILMKKILKLSVIAATTLFALIACGQGGGALTASDPVSTSATSANVEQLLSKMEQDWTDAILRGDAAFQARLLADDYVGNWARRPHQQQSPVRR